MTTPAETGIAAMELMLAISDLAEGVPPAAVYLALSMCLGAVEMTSANRDRAHLLRLISAGMDEFQQQAREMGEANEHAARWVQ